MKISQTQQTVLVSLTAILCGACFALPAAATQPVRYFPGDLGQDGRITLSPGFSPDGNIIYFAQSEGSPIWKFPQRLKVATRTPTGWTKPSLVPLPAAPVIPGREPREPRVDSPSVSPDGTQLLFSWSVAREDFAERDIDENFDLYQLDLTDPNAVPIRFDGADINRIREGRYKTIRYINNENEPVLTPDGDIYFWSERLDGLGERDIYVARANGAGGFHTAAPLPPPINSAGRDNGNFLSPDGRLILISYPDRGGEGGSDIFLSTRLDDVWSDPVPLGPSVNGPSADFGARLTPDGKTLIFNSTRAFDDTPEGLIQLWSIPVANVPVLRDALTTP